MPRWCLYHVFERDGKHLCIDRMYLDSAIADAIIQVNEEHIDAIKDGSVTVYLDAEDGIIELERTRDATPEEIEKYELDKAEQAKRLSKLKSSGYCSRPCSRPCSG